MPTTSFVRIATRGSRLALWQAHWVADALRRHHPGLQVELVEIRTHGDRDRNSPLSVIGGAGLFTKEIQVALLDGAAEIAVHSLKDLPTNGPESLALAAVPPREDRADALIAPVARTLDALPPGARIGTSSMRRRAFLRHNRPDLEIHELRGNVETRLNAALEGRLDAIILAAAGLNRLGLESHITERLEPPRFLPAVGQGALGLECRADDAATRLLLAPLDDPATHRAVVAERAALAQIGGGCAVPLGAWATELPTGELMLSLSVLEADGNERLDVQVQGPASDPIALGTEAARQLRQKGSDRLFRSPDAPAQPS